MKNTQTIVVFTYLTGIQSKYLKKHQINIKIKFKLK